MAEMFCQRQPSPIWQYFGFRSTANTEPDDVNDGKGVGCLTEKLEVCSLSPAALHPTAASCSNYSHRLNETTQIGTIQKMAVVFLRRHIFGE